MTRPFAALHSCLLETTGNFRFRYSTHVSQAAKGDSTYVAEVRAAVADLQASCLAPMRGMESIVNMHVTIHIALLLPPIYLS